MPDTALDRPVAAVLVEDLIDLVSSSLGALAGAYADDLARPGRRALYQQDGLRVSGFALGVWCDTWRGAAVLADATAAPADRVTVAGSVEWVVRSALADAITAVVAGDGPVTAGGITGAWDVRVDGVRAAVMGIVGV